MAEQSQPVLAEERSVYNKSPTFAPGPSHRGDIEPIAEVMHHPRGL
jgi:hypothetical protein